MGQSIPLSRFPFIAHTDVDAVLSTMNRAYGGERSCVGASQTRRVSTFNLLRLGPTSVVSKSMGATSVRSRAEPSGTFYLCRNSRVSMRHGHKSVDAGAGQLLFALSGADRTLHFGEDFAAFVVRINEASLEGAMRLLGHEDAKGWSSIIDVLGHRSPTAEKFCRLLGETVQLYDDQRNFPDRRIDEIMGRSLAVAAAGMLASMLPSEPQIDGPSYEVAEAVERVIAERYAAPLTTSEIAEAVGQTLPCVKASLLLYTGLLPNELLTLVRLIAADEYLRRSFNDPAGVAKASGFVTEERYQFALAQRQRLNGLMRRRSTGRGFAS